MTTALPELFSQYWNQQILEINLIVFANLLGALMLGLVVGYERSYHGRAAGMRTYGIVCMASCALTVFTGFPGFWFGGYVSPHLAGVDPTRVVQGIVTGVGFLGAGVIMKEGMNIRGLTTAASIWASSAIGVLVGVGFYFAAILLALLSAGVMTWALQLEKLLPSRPSIHIVVRFEADFSPNQEQIIHQLAKRGYTLVVDSLSISSDNRQQAWRFHAIETRKGQAADLATMAHELSHVKGVASFEFTRSRS